MKTKTSTPRKGILAGGNWVVDHLKVIDRYPPSEQLANILNHSISFGGAAHNVLLDLARLEAPFPLWGAGAVGKDEAGRQILEEAKAAKIHVQALQAAASTATSYTDVMTEQNGGRRTFFHHRGAGALWRGEDLDFHKITARLFHLGYLLALDALDAPDAKFGTKAGALLAAAQAAGLKTSIDLVSEDSERFAKIVTPALRHTDYCFMNEIEAGKTTGFKIRQPDGQLDTVALRHAAGALLQMGVKELVAIHFPEGGFVRTRKGEDVLQSALNVPAKHIAGATGAGDAFCAGVLLGLHEGWDLSRCLLAAVCVSAACLLEASSTGGIKPLNATLALAKKYKPGPPLEPED